MMGENRIVQRRTLLSVGEVRRSRSAATPDGDQAMDSPGTPAEAAMTIDVQAKDTGNLAIAKVLSPQDAMLLKSEWSVCF